MHDFSDYQFAKVMDYPDDTDELYLFDFSKGYDADFIRQQGWGIGQYNEKRSNMYETSLFNSERNVHVGIDIWAGAGEAVYNIYEGTVAYKQNNDNAGDYGPTIVMKYELNGDDLYALYGHLSEESLQMVKAGEQIPQGQKIATLGGPAVNGGWVPHLHFQLSVEDPGEADMPGVVSPDKRDKALDLYPDPRSVLGKLY
ncbi:peptidoglycan DD-metalloendopeptidase family protein [Fodinibius halophilus]|uniref:Peptidoglycan DD-metalloendopeptidase family protein n=1 Tax=Fodinibius halophilus TaxID=1736908 RepID=A0A6M1T1Y4_9BACT|nr:peptidoglycan DD-metalloendopeptidase family protein [Fodinibius halophilus]NGP90068.1 peptidoglycan DD-metalloendopeptidase family protein [Fodinibius halophilus]